MNTSVRRLFHELADTPRAEREKILRERKIAPEVCAEVESLLSFDTGDAGSLTGQVCRVMQDALRRGNDGVDLGQCGPYKLVRLLGSGGMGAVYLGERADGEIQQQVAIKLLRADVDGPEWRTRFLRERQLLASLNHPAIARVMDAGHTDTGRPYLVMEHVDGQPVDDYAASLDLRGKLEVFARVCDAVAYAHRQLIIHRDLKPSNILVDNAGQVKLLDFGIARLLDEHRQTHTVEMLLTPHYASPEQMRGDIQTTATDVYSLGAVLYRLVHGRAPEQPLEPPVTDVDFIIRKCLRDEPEERYASVDGLAADVRAFVDGRAVQARSGSMWYHVRKLARRHWIPALATVMTIVGLSVGLFVADRERTLAEYRFQQVRQLANKVLALDTVVRDVPGSLKARHEIVAMSQQYLEALRGEAEQDINLAFEIGSAYLALANTQGVPAVSNLGQYSVAIESLRKADGLIETVLAQAPRHRGALLASAEIAHGNMILAETDHRREEAVRQSEKAIARLQSMLATAPFSPGEAVRATHILKNAALCRKNLHQFAASIQIGRRAMEISRTTPEAIAQGAAALSVVADSMRYSGDLDGALTAIEEARLTTEKASFPSDVARINNLFGVLWREGLILGQVGSVSLGRTEDAIDRLSRAFDLVEEGAAQDPHNAVYRILVATAARELGSILGERQPARAMYFYYRGLSRIQEVSNNTKARREEAVLLAGSSYPLRRLNRTAQAEANLRSALALLRTTKDYPKDKVDLDSTADTVIRAHADHLAAMGHQEESKRVLEELRHAVLATNPNTDDDLRNAFSLSKLYASVGEEERRIALWRHWLEKLPNSALIKAQLAAATSHH